MLINRSLSYCKTIFSRPTYWTWLYPRDFLCLYFKHETNREITKDFMTSSSCSYSGFTKFITMHCGNDKSQYCVPGLGKSSAKSRSTARKEGDEEGGGASAKQSRGVIRRIPGLVQRDFLICASARAHPAAGLFNRRHAPVRIMRERARAKRSEEKKRPRALGTYI